VDEETFNMQVRKFLKNVGVNSQREIETAVRSAIKSGKIKGDEMLSARMTLVIEGVNLEAVIKGSISLV
jgi:hypothetical protein